MQSQIIPTLDAFSFALVQAFLCILKINSHKEMTPVIFMSFILVLLKLLIERAKNMNKPHAGVFFFGGGGGGGGDFPYWKQSSTSWVSLNDFSTIYHVSLL